MNVLGFYSRQHLGCFTDVMDQRDLPYARLMNVIGGMTQDICAAHCANNVSILFTMLK